MNEYLKVRNNKNTTLFSARPHDITKKFSPGLNNLTVGLGSTSGGTICNKDPVTQFENLFVVKIT